ICNNMYLFELPHERYMVISMHLLQDDSQEQNAFPTRRSSDLFADPIRNGSQTVAHSPMRDHSPCKLGALRQVVLATCAVFVVNRSEEHTSELLVISYAVFCLKEKEEKKAEIQLETDQNLCKFD